MLIRRQFRTATYHAEKALGWYVSYVIMKYILNVKC